MLGCLSVLIAFPLIIIGGLLGLMGMLLVAMLNLLFLPFEIIASFFGGGKRN